VICCVCVVNYPTSSIRWVAFHKAVTRHCSGEVGRVCNFLMRNFLRILCTKISKIGSFSPSYVIQNIGEGHFLRHSVLHVIHMNNINAGQPTSWLTVTLQFGFSVCVILNLWRLVVCAFWIIDLLSFFSIILCCETFAMSNLNKYNVLKNGEINFLQNGYGTTWPRASGDGNLSRIVSYDVR